MKKLIILEILPINSRMNYQLWTIQRTAELFQSELIYSTKQNQESKMLENWPMILKNVLWMKFVISMRLYQLKILKLNSLSHLTRSSWKIMKQFKTVLSSILTGCKIRFSLFKDKHKFNFSRPLTDCKINTNKISITWMINLIKLEELIKNKLIN